MMKLTRLILACTLLLLASFPMFALPQCGDCENNECVFSPWSGVTCTYDGNGNCITQFRRCSGLAPEATLASDWSVASIEISRPVLDSQIVTTPADVAEVCTTQPAEEK
jgi:hypothetical protein